jgi:hypothetical protein
MRIGFAAIPYDKKLLPVDPREFRSYVAELYGLEFDVMLETKEKERDVLKVKAHKKDHMCARGP